MVELVLFVIFGVIALVGAASVVLARNPVYGAMGLMATMLSFAVFYLVHLGHVIAMVQLIVYAGAVMTLFLFVIMLIGVDREEDLTERLPGQRRLVGVVSAGALALGLFLASTRRFDWILVESPDAPAIDGSAQALARPLFQNWLLPFEVTSLLLIIASIGAIVLAYYRPRRRKETS